MRSTRTILLVAAVAALVFVFAAAPVSAATKAPVKLGQKVTIKGTKDVSSKSSAKLEMEMVVKLGRGYVPAERNKEEGVPVDTISIDAIFSPIRKVNFNVTNARVGQRTDYDRLTLTVETNGTISPEDAVAYAAALAQEHFRFFVDFGKVPIVSTESGGPGNGGSEGGRLRDVLSRAIDDAGLSVRSVNSLKNSNIRTLGDLVRYKEDDLLKVKNVGEKALGEIAELLRREGLNFGMQLEETPGGDVRILDEGVAPQAQLTVGEDE